MYLCVSAGVPKSEIQKIKNQKQIKRTHSKKSQYETKKAFLFPFFLARWHFLIYFSALAFHFCLIQMFQNLGPQTNLITAHF